MDELQLIEQMKQDLNTLEAMVRDKDGLDLDYDRIYNEGQVSGLLEED